MYKNLLIATDGSNLASRAVQHGLSLAKEQNSKVTIITVTNFWSASDISRRAESGENDAIKRYEEFQASRTNKILAEAGKKAKDIGLLCETVHIKDANPADGIIETAKLQNADLIIMASHGLRGIKRAILGSVANEVISASPVPVLIYR